MRRADDLLQEARAVVVCTPDHCGRLIGKTRPIADWPALVAHGLAMPDFHLITSLENRPLPGFAFAGEASGFRNGRLRPDAGAAFLSPPDAATLIVLADVIDADGLAIEEAPRAILRRQITRLGQQGVVAKMASELEFYAFRQDYRDAQASSYRILRPFHHRHGDNDVLVTALAADICDDIVAALQGCGIGLDQIQAEGGTGQLEVNVRPADPLQAADDHVVFKHVVKAGAHAGGYAVTFLAKPFEDDAGSGGHIHLSLATPTEADALGAGGGDLSEFGRRFVAGLVTFMPELTLLNAPYANSYRRLVPGAFTPLRATWGLDNRTTMVRLIAGSDALRLEMRLPGADANPYLAYASMIAAGLGGVEHGLALPPAKVGDNDPDECPAIPADLTEAVMAFERSSFARAAFGPRVHRHLCHHGRHELAATRRPVSSWEVMRGFENA